MMAITHNEVRRHPRWREEQSTPVPAPVPQRISAIIVGALVFLVVLAALAILILKGWVLSLRD